MSENKPEHFIDFMQRDSDRIRRNVLGAMFKALGFKVESAPSELFSFPLPESVAHFKSIYATFEHHLKGYCSERKLILSEVVPEWKETRFEMRCEFYKITPN